MSRVDQRDRDDIIDHYLINKLDLDGVIRLKAVEMAVAFCRDKDYVAPNRFEKIYQSCYEFLKQNPPSNG